MRTAPFIPVVFIRKEGNPLTRLFQEYGSAIKSPGGGAV